MAYWVSNAVAEGVLRTMGYQVIAFGVHLVCRQVWLTAPIAGVIVAAAQTWYATSSGFPIGVAAIAMWSLFQFGLLAAVVTTSTTTVLLNVPWATDLSSWAAGSLVLAVGVLVGVFGFGFYTSLAGQPILGGEFKPRGTSVS